MSRTRLLLCVAAIAIELAASFPNPLNAEESPTGVVLHRRGEHECDTFRIPAIAKTNEGTLLAVYDMRYRSARDLQEDMDIGLSRSVDGGKTWEPPRPIMDMGEYGGLPEEQNGCSDPNIMVDRITGEIWVSALWTYGKPGTHQWVGRGSEPGFEIGKTAQFMVVRSVDDGKTWSPPENWTRRLKDPSWYLFAPAPGNGITTRDGTLVMPTQGRDAAGLPFSNVMHSTDRGGTWTVSQPARTNTTECAVAELSDGRWMLNMRDNRNRSDKGDTNGRAVSTTKDRGQTWTVHSSDHGALPEPVCMASLLSIELPDGRPALAFSNPNSKARRHRMTVRVSLDDGTTWPDEHRLLIDADGGAYSSLVSIDSKTIGLLYESTGNTMIFRRIGLGQLGFDIDGEKPQAEQIVPIEHGSASLPENVFRLPGNLYCGGGPAGDEHFASLAKMGIQTLVTVDGAKPNVDAAKLHGLRYVHIPIGYDGIEDGAGKSLAQVVRTLEGPIYIHCHHGKHRGPAAAAIAAIAAGDIDAAGAAEIMRRAGTSINYTGLWRDVAGYVSPDADAKLPELVEVASVDSFVAAMADADSAMESLGLCQKSGWRTPTDHPDLVPANVALMVEEAMMESTRHAANDVDARFRDWMNESETLARRLRIALQSNRHEQADALFQKISISCTRCHKTYRN